MQQGNIDIAIATLTAAIQHHPMPAEIYLKRSVAYFQKEAFELALADLDQAVALDGKNAQVYSHRGLVRYQMDDEAGALPHALAAAGWFS